MRTQMSSNAGTGGSRLLSFLTETFMSEKKHCILLQYSADFQNG